MRRYYGELLARLAFSGSVRQRVWKKLAAQTRHGMSLDQSLRQMRSRALSRRSPLSFVYTRVLEYLGLGHSLGASLTEFASSEEVMLISSGQRSGRLAEGLELAADLLAARQKIIKAVVGSLAYPVFLFGMCIVLLLVVSIMVMPKFAMLSDPRKWQGAPALFYKMTSFVASVSGTITLVVLFCLFLASIFTLPYWTGKFRLYVEKIPPWSIYRITVGSVWLYTLSTLMRSGIQLSHILESMINSDTITPYLRERIEAISLENGTGKNLGEAMYDCGLDFPDQELIDDLRVYALLPGFYRQMHQLAQGWMYDGVDLVQRQSRVMNLMGIVLITGVVSVLAVAIGSLQSQLLPTGAY
ncbi:Type II secretion system F domain protein [Solidesulfovibrio carbinoliphilus subsp. oakridgensis]|uniref:Type II secretion system F domain protein n=1 Tax=Solidesulfovibrio carbinoliphilus subsp. oakridgensis TaxID=694327 RepID=G7QB73_9BACT|nr:type II secretion system F family protein [Solidesulfovibrio carbinoliphilus]EHJ48815.1 Type II secretion system F domain protein [Solidesulfovibrio carbinoliphilus subsp. oakridgensis]